MLHPILKKKRDELLKKAREAGLCVEVFHEYRSFEEQNALYAKGRTKPGKVVTKARGGFSWHNYGLAFDVVFKVNGKWSWAEKLRWDDLGRIGKECGLEWGGDWKSKDRPHFQYTNGLKIKDAYEIFKRGGLEKIWRRVDK